MIIKKEWLQLLIFYNINKFHHTNILKKKMHAHNILIPRFLTEECMRACTSLHPPGTDWSLLTSSSWSSCTIRWISSRSWPRRTPWPPRRSPPSSRPSWTRSPGPRSRSTSSPRSPTARRMTRRRTDAWRSVFLLLLLLVYFLFYLLFCHRQVVYLDLVIFVDI